MRGRLRDARCSFCGKRQDQVRRLVAGPGVFICDQCVSLCNEVLTDDQPPRQPASKKAKRGGWMSRIFRPKPPTGWSPSVVA